MELKEALKTALDFEKKGHRIYEGASNNTENIIVEKTFRYLADQELIHIEEIEEYSKNQGYELKGDTSKQTQEFFNTTIKNFKKRTELSDDDIKAHETGLELEKRSYDFYEGQAKKAEGPEAKRFFEWLMNQENSHYELSTFLGSLRQARQYADG